MGRDGDTSSTADALERHRAILDRLAGALRSGPVAELAAGAAAAFAEVEAEVDGLRRLVAALSRLHAAPDRAGVLAGIEAVVRDVLGSDEFVAYERAGGALVAARAHGVSQAALRPVPLPADEVAVAPRLAWVRDRPATPSDPPHTLSACVPLVAGGPVVGAVAIYRLREHRATFRGHDRLAIEALGAHGGAALQRAALEALAAR